MPANLPSRRVVLSGMGGSAALLSLGALGAAPAAHAATALYWTTANLNLRSGPGTAYRALTVVPLGTRFYALATSQGWYQLTFEGVIGWVSGKYVEPLPADAGGRAVEIREKYTRNSAGLTDRYFTFAAFTALYESVGGPVRIDDIPANSVVYRDVPHEMEGGQLDGWFFVRTQGCAGWMRSASVVRTCGARTANTLGWTRAQIMSLPNGTLTSRHLVAIPWDSEKTLIAAPALADLTRLNEAFRAEFGRNLDVDLANRTLGTQKYLYQELGPYVAAKPGTSNHGWGMAIDVPETFEYSFDGPYFAWLKANSKNFNWIHRTNLEQYKADGSPNPYAEAWHFEYVGA